MENQSKGEQSQKQRSHAKDTHDLQLTGPILSPKIAEMVAEKVTPEVQNLYAKRREVYAKFHEAVAAAHRAKAEGDEKSFHEAMARRHDIEAEADRINADLYRAGVLAPDVMCW